MGLNRFCCSGRIYGAMKIGLSLPLSYLLEPDTGAAQHEFFKWVGEPQAFLAELRQHGVQTVELQGIAPGFADPAALAAMKRLDAAGMGFTVHSHLPQNVGDPAIGNGVFPDLATPPLPDLRAFMTARSARPVMVVHAYATPDTRYEDLVAISVQSLQALIENLKRHDLPVRVALEINRYIGVTTPGVTYEGLLEIGKHFTDADLGFCWDMGHTQASILRQKLPEAPPPEFVARVIHTHIHDLSPEGKTHWALRDSCPHLEAGVACLETHGYAGIYNLELYPNRWKPKENVKSALLRSVKRLQAIHQRLATEALAKPSVCASARNPGFRLESPP